MRSYDAAATIEAEPETVWAILTDAPAYSAMREEYSGPMLGLIWRSTPDLGPSFEQFARGLKQRAERG